MYGMFAGARAFNQPLNLWDVSNVVDMSYMFYQAFSFRQPLDLWDVSNVKSMKLMFYDALAFNQPLNTWDVSSVKTMEAMLAGAEVFNHPLNAWNVSSVENMESMFYDTNAFNQALNAWDVSNVKNMAGMFHDAIAFNQPLNTWDVSSVKSMAGMFCRAQAFNQPLNNWDVSSVKNMESMFGSNTHIVAFNQPLNNWDVSSVESMVGMFAGATAFNQPLNAWDVSNVQSMDGMFAWAKAFNQDLCPWASRDFHLVSAVSMFYDSGCDNKNDPVLRNLPYQNIYLGPFCHGCIGESYNPRSRGLSFTQCTTSSQCNAGDCNNGSGRICKCSKKGICRLKAGRCVRDADCKGGAVCKNTKCKEPKPGSRGSLCTASSQCNIGNCNYRHRGRICKCSEKGICSLKSGKCDETLRNADCKDGTICKKGRCTAPRPRLPPGPPTNNVCIAPLLRRG
jgi:hypothetical protein